MKNGSLRLVKRIHFRSFQICHLMEGSTRSRYSIIMSISLHTVTSTNNRTYQQFVRSLDFTYFHYTRRIASIKACYCEKRKHKTTCFY